MGARAAKAHQFSVKEDRLDGIDIMDMKGIRVRIVGQIDIPVPEFVEAADVAGNGMNRAGNITDELGQAGRLGQRFRPFIEYADA